MNWTIGDLDMDFQPVITDENDNEVAVVLSDGKNITTSDALVHANIIAKAPLLLGAVISLVAEEDGPIIGEGHQHPDVIAAKKLLTSIRSCDPNTDAKMQ